MTPAETIDLEKTLQNVNVPSVIADRNGSITWLNVAAQRLLGDARGRRFASIVAPEDQALVEEQLQRKLRGVPVTDYEVDIVTRDRERQRVEISSVLVPGGDACHAIFGTGVPTAPPRPAASNEVLTRRQHEVLQLLAAGASTRGIAETLHLSVETVRNHIRHILQRLGAHSRLEAVATAQRRGLL